MTSSSAHWIAPALLASACGLATPYACAGTTTFNDSMVFASSNQNIWSAGSVTDSRVFNVGAQHSWGWRAGEAPVGFGVDAISGGVTHVSMPYPVPSFDVDTRTGAAFHMDTSGYVMLRADTQLSGGQVSVTLPMSSSLQITGTGGGHYHAGGTTSIGTGASMSVKAPSLNATLGGGLGLDGTLSGQGCFIGAGCSSSSSSFNIDGYASNILAVNTASAGTFTSFGLPIPGVPQLGKPYDLRVDASSFYKPTMSPVIGQFTAFKLPDLSAASHDGNELSLTARSDLLNVTANVSGMAAVGMGTPIDVFNPSLDLKVGKVSLTSVTGSIGVANDLQTAYTLDPVLMTKLTFDRDVYTNVREVVGTEQVFQFDSTCLFPGMRPDCVNFNTALVQQPIYGMVERDVGRSLTFAVQDGADLRFDGVDGNLVDRQYFLDANFTNTGTLVQKLELDVDAACARYSFSMGLGSGQQCAFSQQFQPATSVERQAYQYSFDLGGFNPILYPQEVAAVPEAGTSAMLMAGLLGAAALRTRRTIAARRS